jgi:hypothetical protein
MKKKRNPAFGERAAISGYLPQFELFAYYVYKNLINNQLEWIKIADPEAGILDDIQYSTHTEIHAFQIKWTNADATISFSTFKKLVSQIATSWQHIKLQNPEKKVYPHLITAKQLSQHDSVNDQGSFTDFIDSAWNKVKLGLAYDTKWEAASNILKIVSGLDGNEFSSFLRVFDFQFDFKRKDYQEESQEKKDIEKLTGFIIEQLSGGKTKILYSRGDIIKALGWEVRFETFFSHELIIDKRRYQPIKSSLAKLDEKINEYKNGYLFLVGNPGSGKSSLLSYWSSEKHDRIIKYYAFDFQSPSSTFNFYERGESISLFHDLVLQLRNSGLPLEGALPYRDITFLKNAFNKQLKYANSEYEEEGKRTIIIIDGLDHVPREYTSVVHSFLKELLFPDEIPDGVNILLSSQSFELRDLHSEIKDQYHRNDRTVRIDPLLKDEVFKYVDKTLENITDELKLIIFNKSQGHPLYLSYMVERIRHSANKVESIQSFIDIDGDIENYYKRIWEPILNDPDQQLIELLGLLARINGSVNIRFMTEWDLHRSTQLKFIQGAISLFNNADEELSFFHNSFRQFLLDRTSTSILTNSYDKDEDIRLHSRLSDYYNRSKVEPYWKSYYHLFKAERNEEFLLVVTPEKLSGQFLEYRPVREINQDAKLGIEIASRKKDVYALVRYTFLLAEFERRLLNIDPAALTEEFLFLGKNTVAKKYLRSGNTLHCNPSYALKYARDFIRFGDRLEANILFNLAYPDYILEDKIEIPETRRYEDIRDTIGEWIRTASYFLDFNDILIRVTNINFPESIDTHPYDTEDERAEGLRSHLLMELGNELIENARFEDFLKIINILHIESKFERNILFRLLESAILKCLKDQDKHKAVDFLNVLTNSFNKENTTDIGKIYLADLIFKVTGEKESVLDLIRNVSPPLEAIRNDHRYRESLDKFIPLIKLNKLLNICDHGLPVNVAIPQVQKDSDEELLVEFERNLCLIAQIQSEGLTRTISAYDLIKRIRPIIGFYYRKRINRNSYWYRLSQLKEEYFNYLIHSVSLTGIQNLNRLADFLFEEFTRISEFWQADARRNILKSLLSNGFEPTKLKLQLHKIDKIAFKDLDIDGRVRGCLNHSELWRTLGDMTESEKWLKNALKESLGVGYSKDYQFNTWIDWLEVICKTDPSNAEEEIKWFLARLPHIKETTEGRAFWRASERLLSTTFKLNFRAGFQQLKWQLDHALIDFGAAMDIFIEAYLKNTTNEVQYRECFELYCELYLLISADISNSLFELLMIKGYEILDQKFAETYLIQIIDKIKINSLSEFHFTLLTSIREFCSSHGIFIEKYYPGFSVPEKRTKDEERSSSQENLALRDGTRISMNKVLEIADNFDSLYNLISSEDNANSYYNWTRVFDRLPFLMTPDQIRKLSELKQTGSKRSEFFAVLSRKASINGDLDLAKRLANKSIELSSESGWARYYDGGTRINAFEALKKVDEKVGMNEAFDTFCNDVLNTDYAYSYIEHFDEVLPVIFPEYDTRKLWKETFDYLNRLIPFSDPVDLPDIQFSVDPPDKTYIGYLFWLSKSLTFIVKEKSLYLIASRISNDDEYASNSLIENPPNEQVLIDLMMLVREMKPEKLVEFRNIALQFAISKNYSFRSNARIVLKDLKISAPVPEKIKLPGIYSLIIPEKKKLKIRKDLDPFFPEININDPEELISPFGFLINILSEDTGIDRNNLLLRVNQLMSKSGKKQDWTIEHEKELRSYLDEIHHKFSYPRPRVLAAKDAILKLVSELIDVEMLEENGYVRELFRKYDYKVLFFNVIPKPDFIQTLKERDFGGVGSDWLDRIKDCSRFDEKCIEYRPGFRIIGEYTSVKNLDWGGATEVYMSVLDCNDLIKKDIYSIFGSAFHVLTEEYMNDKIISQSIIVIRDHRFDQFGVKSEWIAINPTMAKFLKWIPDENKIFGWKDQNGNPMVESIYWNCGNFNMIPRQDSEVGEGWFVIASDEAIDQIRNVEPILYQKKMIWRLIMKESKPEENKISRTSIYTRQ